MLWIQVFWYVLVCHLVSESCCPHIHPPSCETSGNTHPIAQHHIPENLNPLSNTAV